MGALWVHVAGVGTQLRSLHSPLVIGILFALSALLIGGGVASGSRKRRRERRAGLAPRAPSPPSATTLLEGKAALVVALAGLALLPLLALCGLAFSRPATGARPLSLHYEQRGSLSYSADPGPGPAYPDGRLTTGDPIFTHVVGPVRLGFRYRFKSAAPSSIHGSASLVGRIDSTSGWSTTLPLAGPLPFTGARTSLVATLSVPSLPSAVPTR
jgi:hypothetical protein